MASPLLAVSPADSTLRFQRGSAPAPMVAQCVLSLTLARELADGAAVLFRIQTTSPATYRVKPSQGRVVAKRGSDGLPAGVFAERVAVQLSMTAEPTKADKFQIKAVLLTPAEAASLGAAATPEETAALFNAASDRISKAGASAQGDAFEQRLRVEFIDEPAEGAASRAASSASIDALPKRDALPDDAALRELRNKVALLTAANADLTKRLEDVQRSGTDPTVDAAHPATALPDGLSEEELAAMIRAQAGFPPVLVLLIAIFAFLVGLLF